MSDILVDGKGSVAVLYPASLSSVRSFCFLNDALIMTPENMLTWIGAIAVPIFQYIVYIVFICIRQGIASIDLRNTNSGLSGF